MKRRVVQASTSLVAGAFVLLVPALACDVGSGNPIVGALDQALASIAQERAGISIVGRALTRSEKIRLDKLERAAEFIEKAKLELSSSDHPSLPNALKENKRGDKQKE